jgi:hypothetical protein
MKQTTEILGLLRNSLAILGSIAKSADKRANLPALVFLIGMAELEASRAEADAKRRTFTNKNFTKSKR